MRKQKKIVKKLMLLFLCFFMAGSGKNLVVSYGAGHTTVQEQEVTLKLSENQEQSKVTITLSGISKISDGEKIKICVSNSGYEEPLVKWYQAKKQQKEYKGVFSIEDFGNAVGRYEVSVYLENSEKEKELLAKKTITLKGIEGGKVSFQKVNSKDGTCQVKISGLKTPAKIKIVKVLVYSAKNNKNDAQWYKAKKKNNNWYIEFNTENHDYFSGKYIFQTKVWDTRGVSCQLKEKAKTIHVSTKVSTEIKGNKEQSKYTVTIENVRRVDPIDKVMIAVWGEENGDKDKKWYTAKDKGNGTYVAVVNIKNHKEAGKYCVETYVKAEGETKEIENKSSFTTKGVSAKTVDFSYHNDEKGSVQINVKGASSPAGIEKVEISAYTSKRGKDDLVVKKAIYSKNMYKSTLSVADHEFGTGKYKVDITVTDNRGITKKLNTRTVQLNCSDNYKAKMTFSGIDVSRYQGNIDWNRVKLAGIDFVMIQAGYRHGQTGVILEDRYFETNIKGALAAGIDVGVYFFSQAITEAEAKEEAEWIMNKIAPYKITYPVTIDSEYRKNGRANSLNAAVRTNVVNAFCKTVQEGGYTPMIYASKSWLEDNLYMSYLSEYEVWLARYHVVPEYIGTFHMWQYTNEGHVPGIDGYVDRNIGYKRYY